MGTTDNFDTPAKGSFALADQIPIKDSATSRGAYSLGSEVLSGLNGVVAVSTGAVALTVTQALHGNRAIVFNNTAPIAITLPSATGSGAKYALILSAAATATASTIQIGHTGDVMQGLILSLNTTAGVLIGFKHTATSNTISLNGTTTGGAVGAVYTITDIASGVFQVKGEDTAAMTTTPYSHV